MSDDNKYNIAIKKLHHFYANTLRFSCQNWVVNFNHQKSDRNDLHADEVISILRDMVKKFPVSEFDRYFVLHLISDEHLKKAVFDSDKWDRAKHAVKSAYFILSDKAHYRNLGNVDYGHLNETMYSKIAVLADYDLNKLYSGFANTNLLDIYLEYDVKYKCYKIMAIYTMLKNTVKYKKLNVKKYRKVLLSTLQSYLNHFDPNAKDDFAKSLKRTKDKVISKKDARNTSGSIIPRMDQFSIQMKLHYINKRLYLMMHDEDIVELSHDQFVALLDCFFRTPGTPKQYIDKSSLTDELIKDCRDTARTEQEYKSY